MFSFCLSSSTYCPNKFLYVSAGEKMEMPFHTHSSIKLNINLSDHMMENDEEEYECNKNKTAQFY